MQFFKPRIMTSALAGSLLMPLAAASGASGPGGAESTRAAGASQPVGASTTIRPDPAEGKAMSNTELAAAVCAGRWEEIARSGTDTEEGHFCRAIAHGLLWEWGAMDIESEKVPAGSSAVAAFCEGMLAAHPTNAFARFANAARLNRQPEKAIAEYRKAAELAPNFAAPCYQIGVILGTQRRHREALASLDAAIQADPGFAPAYVARGNNHKDGGRLAAAVGEYKKAVEILESRKIESGDQLGRALYNWGWVLINQPSPDNDEGIKILTRAIRADPKRLEAYNELGIAYKRKNRFADAIAAYQEGIKLGDNSAMIWFNLGVSEYRNGNSAGARSAFRKASELDPNGSTGATARQWLGRVN